MFHYTGDLASYLDRSRLHVGRTRLRTFVQYLTAFCSRLETVNDVISGTFVRPVVHDKRVKSRAPRLNHSREIQTEAVGGGIFYPLKLR